eukprot:GHRQ01027906.1.p4 GENE.GHRQ01027906.1~~GHRQ01027906.1.p4  ORF type:complete len:113 (+),score=21.13 GHRQ01027906.1:782-1120(+)
MARDAAEVHAGAGQLLGQTSEARSTAAPRAKQRRKSGEAVTVPLWQFLQHRFMAATTVYTARARAQLLAVCYPAAHALDAKSTCHRTSRITQFKLYLSNSRRQQLPAPSCGT